MKKITKINQNKTIHKVLYVIKCTNQMCNLILLNQLLWKGLVVDEFLKRFIRQNLEITY